MRAIACSTAGILGFVLLLGGSGCTTLSRGSHQTVTFTADAPGAVVAVRGRKPVEAPARIELSRKNKYTVVVTAPNRQSVEFTLKPGFDGLSLGNLIYPGGSVGLLVDFLSGADKRFKDFGTINLPDVPESPDAPAVVHLYQHKGKFRTRQEISALESESSAEVASDQSRENDADARDESKLAGG